MSDQSLTSRLNLAVESARAAGDLILRYYQNPELAVEQKADASPVTVADREAEQLLRTRIRESFPDDAILGEEYGVQAGTSGWRWILDPVDGTKSFVHGVPLFGTLIGVERDGRAEVGVCRMPALNEMAYAATGQGCWWQQGDAAPILARVSNVATLNEALLCYTSHEYFARAGESAVFETLRDGCRLSRGWGDCYGHLLVATGRADVIVEPGLHPWDAAALVPLVREAGGCFLDWNGRESFESGNGMSVNAALREEILSIVQTCRVRVRQAEPGASATGPVTRARGSENEGIDR
ncbi:MAG: histidinol-phosphatase [Planctomycetaceae bacterium]|nr:histidinol-phosphatase [Planctomycetaceae bacterium]